VFTGEELVGLLVLLVRGGTNEEGAVVLLDGAAMLDWAVLLVDAVLLVLADVTV